MNEPRLISPLLDNFIMGDPISNHNGIRCCPAMDNNTSEKYIVKIISLPASQTQLDALLLTKAFDSEEAAGEYYKSRASEMVAEIDVLQALARTEGFLSCKGYQVIPMDNGVGYEIYLLTEYKRSLERHLEKKPFTHLDAVNLGLDICAALTACRRNGYIFANLKPSNIYISEKGEFKIGDLGLISMSGLKYATLPEHYIGPYTAPESKDAFSSLNDTLDVFSIGAILYAVYNGNIAPDFDEDTLPAPQYADEEICQIILKACSKDPSERWSDPAQMGQALVSYMQKVGASDIPIVPPVIEVPENIEPAADNTVVEEDSTEELHPVEEPIADTVTEGIIEEEIAEEIVSSLDSDVSEDILEIESLCEEESDAEINTEPTNAIIIADDVHPETNTVTVDDAAEEVTKTEPEEIVIDSPDSEFIPEEITDENISYDEISEEVSQILNQADELASMEVPDPVVAPEPIEIVLPSVEQSDDGNSDDEQATESNDSISTSIMSGATGEIEGIKRLLEDNPEESSADQDNEYDDYYYDEPPKRRVGKYIAIILILIALLAGGFLFYKLYVLQTINDLTITGSRDHLYVEIDTETDESLLSITCTDLYGQNISVPVVNGKAEFSGLLADSEYTINVEISGLHILEGDIKAYYSTPEETSIIQHSSVTGNTPGSVIISFTIQGPDSTEEGWQLTYGSGADQQSVTFSGHTVTVSDLLEDKVYTGVLEPVDDLFFKEPYEITFTAGDVIQASELFITSCTDNKLVAKWTVPENTTVSGWIVRCTNGEDYDKTITTSDTFAEFTELDHTDSFTVEVTAVGQSVSQKVSIKENAVTVSDITADTAKAGVINLSWNTDANPQNGWIISYTVNGTPFTATAEGSARSFTLIPAIPNCEYRFTIQSAEDESTVCEPCVCQTPEAEDFSVNYHGNLVTVHNLSFTMCTRPNSNNWSYKDLRNSNYTNVFEADDYAGFVIFLNRRYDISSETITTAFVILDETDRIVSINSSSSSWSGMWFKNYCELNIPDIPDEPGNYKIQVYFNGQYANMQSFTVE